MRKFASLFTMLMLFTALAFGQNRTITGTVTDESGAPVAGASVQIKNTRTGVATGNDGTFRIQAKTGDVLVITGVGLEPTEVTIGSGSSVTAQVKRLVVTDTEVVVTSAYGIKSTLKAASTNTQVVTAEQLNTIRQTNLNNALAGKVSGMQVRAQSTAKLGNAGTGSIRLRGESGFGGGQGVIYVVDGTILPNPLDINMDDIEDVTVLQGPAAAAIFGPQGAGGAIVMTLKKAKRNQKGLGVEVNMGVQFDRVYILPNYQNSYAGGNTADMIKYTWQPGHPELWKKLDGKYFHDYSDDASWGPRMVGQEYIPWYSWYDNHRYAGTTAALNPQPNNARDYYNTGIFLNNTVSVNSAGEKHSMRMSFGNVDVKGLIPTTTLKKNTFSFVGSLDIMKNLTASLNFNYVTQKLNGEFDDQYSNQTTGSFNQWFHRNLDMDILRELKDLRTPSGIWASWNHLNPAAYNPDNEKPFYAGNYWYNFFKWFDLVKQISNTDRYYGDLSLSYKINNNLKVTGVYRKVANFVWSEAKYYSDLQASATQTTGNCAECFGYYGTNTSNSNVTNMNLLIDYNQKFGDFNVKSTIGTDIYRSIQKSNGANTVQGLNVPNLFTIANSKNPATISNGRSDFRYSALFIQGGVGFRNFLNLDFTLRQDWASSNPPAKPFVVSKSAGISFIFSELLKWEPLSFGKIRASWGEIPGFVGTFDYPGSLYSISQNQWNGNLLMQTNNTLTDPNIKGYTTQQKEIGIDLKFLRNRVGASFTYWNGDDRDFVTNLTLTGATGYTGLRTNAGLITKRGYNIQASGRPVWSRDIKVELNANWGVLAENKVVEIAEGITQTAAIDGRWGTTGPYLLHQVGKDWGQIYGNGMKRINGQPVLNSSGFFVNDPNVSYGSALPKHTGGAQLSVQFKGIILNANADFQVGGKFFSLSDQWGSFSGLTARTATVNDKGNPIRDKVADGGGVHVFGVDNDGKPVDYYVEAQDYFHNLYNNRAFDPYVYDLTFVKLREVSLGYELPVRKWGINWMNTAVISVVARNPWLIYAKTADFDPSEIANLSGESGNMPGTRSLGVNLKIGL